MNKDLFWAGIILQITQIVIVIVLLGVFGIVPVIFFGYAIGGLLFLGFNIFSLILIFTGLTDDKPKKRMCQSDYY